MTHSEPSEGPPPIDPQSPGALAQTFHTLLQGILHSVKQLEQRVARLEAIANRREKDGGF